MRLAASLVAAAALVGCRVLTGGLDAPTITTDAADAVANADPGDGAGTEGAAPPVDAGEPPGVGGAPVLVGCSDGTREGFRDLAHWPAIAGCAGAFDQPGVIGAPSPKCDRQAGDTSVNPAGTGCGAADLCAEHWHLCRDGTDVAQHSPTGDCESCVPAGEARFFLAAAGASTMGICSPDREASNDLHGCGGLGQPESAACAPLARRMGFADCQATNAWSCGTASESLREAAVVTKPGIAMGGALCCRD